MTTLATPTLRRIGPVDLLWLTWRQHRIAIVTGGVLVAAFYATTLVIGRREFLELTTCSPHCGDVSVFGLAWLPAWIVVDALGWLASAFGLLVGVFWAAPMIAREYEQRTDVLAWGQDTTVTRWLSGKTAVLGVIAAGYAAVIGVAMSGAVTQVGDLFPIRRDDFESAPALHIAYALFGLMLGVAVSAFVRRTVAAMGITAALFVVVRFVLYELRFTWLTPVRFEVPLTAPYTSFSVPPAIWENFGDQGAPGHQTFVIDYQPADRLVAFRLIEIATFVVLAGALAVGTWLRMRRAAASR